MSTATPLIGVVAQECYSCRRTSYCGRDYGCSNDQCSQKGPAVVFVGRCTGEKEVRREGARRSQSSRTPSSVCLPWASNGRGNLKVPEFAGMCRTLGDVQKLAPIKFVRAAQLKI